MMRWTLALMLAGLLGLATVGCEPEEPAGTPEPAPTEPEIEPDAQPDDGPAPEPGV